MCMYMCDDVLAYVGVCKRCRRLELSADDNDDRLSFVTLPQLLFTKACYYSRLLPRGWHFSSRTSSCIIVLSYFLYFLRFSLSFFLCLYNLRFIRVLSLHLLTEVNLFCSTWFLCETQTFFSSLFFLSFFLPFFANDIRVALR